MMIVLLALLSWAAVGIVAYGAITGDLWWWALLLVPLGVAYGLTFIPERPRDDDELADLIDLGKIDWPWPDDRAA